MEANSEETFLNLIHKHLPKTKKFDKTFMGNNVRVSYSSLTNFASMIKSHINKILSVETVQGQPKCNFTRKDTCPLEGHCLDKELTDQFYLKENTSSDGVTYYGLMGIRLKINFTKTVIFLSTRGRKIPQTY